MRFTSGLEVLLGVDNDLIAPCGLCGLCLSVGRDGAYDGCAKTFGHLDHEKAETPGGGMDQAGLAFLQGVTAMDKIVGGGPLPHDRSRAFAGAVVGEVDDALGGDAGHLGVGPESPVIAHPVPDAEAGNVISKGCYRARALGSGGVGHLHGVFAAALVDVPEVDADGFLFDLDLAGGGGWQLEVLVDHDLGAALLFDSDGFHVGILTFQSARL